jgi:hypothetical protein
MFKSSDSDIDTKARHTCSGKVFKEVHLANLFKKNYRDEGFYSGEEEDLTDKEYSESVGIEEPRQEEPETSRTASNVDVSTIIPHVTPAVLSNQINLSHQNARSTVASSSPHTQ